LILSLEFFSAFAFCVLKGCEGRLPRAKPGTAPLRDHANRSQSRQRRVKCDGVRPVCGRCLKRNRQCVGFSEGHRLILKDETEAVIDRAKKKIKVGKCEEGGISDSPASTDGETSSSQGTDRNIQRIPNTYTNADESIEWLPVTSVVRLTPAYERNQVALFCCRQTVNLRTMSWIMSDEKWLDLLPQMMSRSEALTSVIHANASNYLAKVAGAPVTPRQAFTHYAYALKELQRDLYDPVRQRSDETLFAIILLAIFDVCFFYFDC
jgi:hypothetical protein